MTTYERGTGINIVQRFYVVDPFTEQRTPADPTTVTFTVEAPDGGETSYLYGAAPEVTRVGVGVYVLRLPPPPAAGTYRWRAAGTGDVEAAGEDTFSVVESGILDPSQPALPLLGPCSSWISGDDVAACCGVEYGSSPDVLDAAAFEASMALYEISGRRFPGDCPRKVRPAADPCRCGWPASSGLGPWFWGGSGGWAWRNECGDQAGCRPLSVVRLGGYPVREIVAVKIDGAVLPPVDGDGRPNYRLDRWRDLVRLSDAAGSPRLWPGCQDLSLPDTDPGTFSVSYRWGEQPPQLARDAAAALACQLYASCSGGDCQLPAGATRVTRQGVEVERGLLANWFDPTKGTGIVAVDLFLRAYARGRPSRRPAVFSPDVQPFARREGV